MPDPNEISDEELEAFLASTVTDNDGTVNVEPSDEQLHDWEETLANLGENMPQIVPVSTLTEIQLIDKYNEVKEELLQRGEALRQTTQTGRDLQSERTALLIEMRKRGLR